jgi:hypothetical protein
MVPPLDNRLVYHGETRGSTISKSATHFFLVLLVPTLCVGTPAGTLCVLCRAQNRLAMKKYQNLIFVFPLNMVDSRGFFMDISTTIISESEPFFALARVSGWRQGRGGLARQVT